MEREFLQFVAVTIKQRRHQGENQDVTNFIIISNTCMVIEGVAGSGRLVLKIGGRQGLVN